MVFYLLTWPKEKKEEIWLSPMTKAPTPSEKSENQRDNTNTTIVDRLRMVS